MKKRNIIFSLLGLCAGSAYLYAQNNWIGVTRYPLGITDLPKNLSGMKIAHLSDVHIPQNGSTIENIVALTRAQRPDLIFLTGDLVDDPTSVNWDILRRLIRGLAGTAPTYAVPGNHEYIVPSYLGPWRAIMEECGATVLINKAVETSFNGASFLVVGLDDKEPYAPATVGISEEENRPILLLAHHPEYWESYIKAAHPVLPDAVFVGHAHGGQWRLPKIGGLFASSQGLLPLYSEGQFKEEGAKRTTMTVSRGLGNTLFPFRLHNRPEIVLATVEKAK